MADSPLRRARKSRNIGIRQMAETIGYDKGDLSRVEREMDPPRTVEWLANRYEIVLGLERDSLLRECGTLPATLWSALNSADPGYLGRLTYLRAALSPIWPSLGARRVATPLPA